MKKYTAPDYEIVQLQVSSMFASYHQSGCPHDEYTAYTSPCTTADPNYVHRDYLALGWGHGCYTIEMP